MRTVVALLSVALLAVLVVAAPVPKDKGKEEPATDEQRKEAQDNFKQIMLAMHNYHDATGTWPTDLTDPKTKKPVLSWRVAILPYTDGDAAVELYKKFDLNEPWDGKTNKPLIDELPKIYAPVRPMKVEKGETFYRGFGGKDPAWGGAFPPGGKVGMGSFTDGLSNTIGVIDAGEPVIWTKPGTDLDIDPKKELPKLGRMIDGDTFYCGMMDGSVREVKRKFDEKEMRKFIGRADGEVVNDNAVFAR
jgi:hypothetical protein